MLAEGITIMKGKDYIDKLSANGVVSFSADQMSEELKLSLKATESLIARLKRKNEIVSPARGYYLIVPPEFRVLGCLPPDYFIDDLMRYFRKEYYVCLLSAALYHGAAHQQPQLFQVMVRSRRRNIFCGHVKINFIQNKFCVTTPTVQLKTHTGFMNVSTPEATAMDLLNFMHYAGGIHHIIAVLEELSDVLSSERLLMLAEMRQEIRWVQRLGYLLERLDKIELSEMLFQYLQSKSMRIIPLVPDRSMLGGKRDLRWKIIVNVDLMGDFDDTN